MTIEAMRFAAAGKIIDDQKRLIDCLYSERDEARKLAEEWRDRWAGDAPAICLPLERQLPWEEK